MAPAKTWGTGSVVGRRKSAGLLPDGIFAEEQDAYGGAGQEKTPQGSGGLVKEG
jgi:hypothetical protein